MINENLDSIMQQITQAVGQNVPLKSKKIQIGQAPTLPAIIFYMDGLVNLDIINRDILNPLMLHVNEHIAPEKNPSAYLCERYIAVSGTSLEKNVEEVANGLKSGKTVIILDKANEFIMIDTAGGEYRKISEPSDEMSLRGSRESFVENLDTNITMLKREIKDSSLSIEYSVIGRRSKTPLALVYIDNIVDKNILNNVKEKIKMIDVDFVSGTGMIEQYIEDWTYTIFPQVIYSERPDRIASKLMEGKIAVLLQGTPFVFTVPTLFIEFFHTVEDYYERTIIANVLRLLRILSIFIVISFPAIYLTLLKFNTEMIPIDFVVPIVRSRTGIPLTPFIEILVLEILVEILREGGLRLPSKIAQTIGIVGGIIISDAAIQAGVVSPSTLLVVGIATISSFLIPIHEMSYTIRLLRFPMLLLANMMGVFGIATGFIILMIHLLSLRSFGVPYLTFYKSDLKDFLIRAPLWQMNRRPKAIPNSNNIRQKKTEKPPK